MSDALQTTSADGFALWPLILKAAAEQADSVEDAINTVAGEPRVMSDVWGLEQARDALYILAEYNAPMTVDDVALIAPDVLKHTELGLDLADRVLRWAARLGVVHRGANNSYRIDATYLAGKPESVME